jgi:hypothetical protein
MTICNPDLIEKVKNELIKRGGLLPCPRCGKKNFSIINEGLIIHPLQKEDKYLVLSGRSIPVVAVICTNCGFISEHALGTLGLLNDDTTSASVTNTSGKPAEQKKEG